MTSDITQVKIDIIKKYYPFESDLIETDALEAIVNGAKPEIPSRGESFDLTTVFEIIASTVATISSVVQIYLLLEERKQKKPTREEFKEEVKQVKFTGLSDKQRNELLEELFTSLDLSDNKK